MPKAVLAEFEKPGILKARSFFPPEVLKGEHYTVDDKVNNDGFLNHYSVNSSLFAVIVIQAVSFGLEVNAVLNFRT